MATGGLLRDTVIGAKAPEEVKVMAIMMAAWRVLISNANFMPKCCGEGGNCIKNREE
jgi:hypothetical protein